jgi:hypothetical protein
MFVLSSTQDVHRAATVGPTMCKHVLNAGSTAVCEYGAAERPLLKQTVRIVTTEFKILSAIDSRIVNKASGKFTSLYKNYSRFAIARHLNGTKCVPKRRKVPTEQPTLPARHLSE